MSSCSVASSTKRLVAPGGSPAPSPLTGEADSKDSSSQDDFLPADKSYCQSAPRLVVGEKHIIFFMDVKMRVFLQFFQSVIQKLK